MVPDEKSIQAVLQAVRKKPYQQNAVNIARYKWLSQRNFPFPFDMELPNLCLTIKDGKLIRTIYSNVLTHIIKKQRYHIQILN